MSTELHAANGRHNHPPRCCCSPDDMGRGIIICPVCPEHGELAPTVECPQCHQPAGRPHTEYCPLAIREEVFADPTHGRIDRDIQDQVEAMNPTSLGQRVAMENTLQDRRGGIGQTSQPATRTSQATTQARDKPPGQWLHHIGTGRVDHRILGGQWHDSEHCTPDTCGATPDDGELTPLATPTLVATHGPRTTGHIDLPRMPIPPGLPPDESRGTPLATPTPLCPCAYNTGPVQHHSTCPEYH